MSSRSFLFTPFSPSFIHPPHFILSLFLCRSFLSFLLSHTILFFFFLLIRPPPNSPLFPYPPLFRSPAIVPAVSYARSGDTSMLTKPSPPSVASYVGRNRSAAHWMSSTARRSNICRAARPSLTNRR